MNTPIEAIAHEMPLRVVRYRLRTGSGGRGWRAGGDGVERVIETRVPATLSMLSERSTSGPYGVRGGEPGAAAAIEIERAGGERKRLAPRSHVSLEPGDRVRVLTPGGGGFGRPAEGEGAQANTSREERGRNR
jgi:N-methylhydantoinase B/oxoprolinase/acetone carboxylase alpha subunit